jgi:hypothetical protein
VTTADPFPQFFRARQKLLRPSVKNLQATVQKAFHESQLSSRLTPNSQVAITAGSRGIHQIAEILAGLVQEVKNCGASPFIVPAMGSHGGGTAEGQVAVLRGYGITESSMGCEIRSSMETVVVCQANEGFPVHFDARSSAADHVIVVNRVKPHTRFFGSVESGLMKMMLIGLGKHQGALVYHRVIQDFTFDQIVRSVAREVISRCRIAGGIAILENGYDETADIVGVPSDQIETQEAELLSRVKELLPKLPFDAAELLIIDEIGKNISGSGMDTNVVGRKTNDKAALGDEKPRIHHIYVRGLTPETEGNAAGIGVAEMCHEKVLKQIDHHKTRINCITAAHIAGAAMPVDFPNDRAAIEAAIGMGGWGESQNYSAMWIPNTLHIDEVECSQCFWESAQGMPSLELLTEPRPLAFDARGDLPQFGAVGVERVA